MISNTIDGLRKALPYLQLYRGKLFLIKIGGDGIRSIDEATQFVEQIAVLHSLGIGIVVVHGGGAQADVLACRLGIESEKVGGRRITSSEMMRTMVLALNGEVQSTLLSAAKRCGLKAVGVSGMDCGLVQARKRLPVPCNGNLVDFGAVGDVVSVDCTLIKTLLNDGVVPFISPLSGDDEGNWLNINADTIAAELAVHLRAEKAMFLTEPLGVQRDSSDSSTLISELTSNELTSLETDGVVCGGMIPKFDAIRKCLESGVDKVHVISYKQPDSLLIEVFTNEGCGTLVTLGPKQ